MSNDFVPLSEGAFEAMEGRELHRWADAAQYRSEPMPNGAQMTVTLLNAMPDPLGTLAALCAIYKGRVVRDLRHVTYEERLQALEDMLNTELNGPLEGPVFHFVIEGVTRSFTHQAVRDRFSFIAQESLRFAVKEGWAHEVPTPPSLAGLPDDDPMVRIWRKNMIDAEDKYAALVAAGMPAEEARGILPHDVTTRYHWVCSLRTLLREAGKRTCTQAQFHWRLFFAEVAKALRAYGAKQEERSLEIIDYPGQYATVSDRQQFERIADLLRPHCYQTGSCGFMAQFDRGCTIRERVEKNAKRGRPSSEWDQPLEVTRCTADSDCPGGEHCGMEETVTLIGAIHPREWATDPGAART